MSLTKNKPKMIESLEMVAELVPGPLFWKDKQGVWRGINRCVLEVSGHTDYEQMVGKTDYEIWPKEIADELRKNDLEVMNERKTIHTEETISIPNGEIRYFQAMKTPLLDNEGNVIGIVGNSIDITGQKEAEKLKLENERQQVLLQEHENFAQLARKVSHDINSPLASLQMIIGACKELPETPRLMLTRATESILDISNNLTASYHKDKNQPTTGTEPRQPVLASDLLIQLLSEKKMQYRNHPVRFDSDVANEAQFAFIRMQKTELRRSLSNLINNAVDALENQPDGVVTVRLTVDASSLQIAVQDNGNGMPEETVERIRNNNSFTEGKKNGHGLGLQQVWDTLENNEGIMEIESTPGKGTSIQLIFPRVAAADWIAQHIHISPSHTIAILDDEESIHGAWKMRFSPSLAHHPNLKLHHFTQGHEVLHFASTLSQEAKNQVLFLSDYELLSQEKNGLEIIDASQLKHAILVTSYYTNYRIRDAATKLGVKMLPKQMASVIPIQIS